MKPLRSGTLVDLRTLAGVSMARIIAPDLPPSPWGYHDGSNKYVLARRFNGQRWLHARAYKKSAIIRAHTKDEHRMWRSR